MKRFALLFAALAAFATFATAAIIRDPSEILNQARIALEQGQFDRGVELLTQAIKQDPAFAPAYLIRGLANTARDKNDDAIADFSKAHELTPEDVQPLLLRAAAYQKKKEWNKALDDFSSVIKMKPGSGEAYLNRGLCYAQMDDEDKALADFDKAVEIDSNDVHALQLRGSMYSQKGDKDKALADFKQAIKGNPNDPVTYLFRAQHYLMEDEPELALQDYEELMRRAPAYSEAINDYAWTLATNPKESVRNGRRAVEYAKKACYESEYKNPGWLDTLAAAHAEAGDWDEAVKWQEEAVKLAEKSSPDDVKDMKDRLELFKQKKPYRESPKRLKKDKP